MPNEVRGCSETSLRIFAGTVRISTPANRYSLSCAKLRKLAANICVSDGNEIGHGENQTDTTLSATAVEMHVIYRGAAALSKSGFVWGSIATVDQNEFYLQLEKPNIYNLKIFMS